MVARISPVVPEAAVPTPRDPNCGVPVVPVTSAKVHDTFAEPFTDFPVDPIVMVLAVVHVAAEVAVVAFPDKAPEKVPTVKVLVLGL